MSASRLHACPDKYGPCRIDISPRLSDTFWMTANVIYASRPFLTTGPFASGPYDIDFWLRTRPSAIVERIWNRYGGVLTTAPCNLVCAREFRCRSSRAISECTASPQNASKSCLTGSMTDARRCRWNTGTWGDLGYVRRVFRNMPPAKRIVFRRRAVVCVGRVCQYFRRSHEMSRHRRAAWNAYHSSMRKYTG